MNKCAPMLRQADAAFSPLVFSYQQSMCQHMRQTLTRIQVSKACVSTCCNDSPYLKTDWCLAAIRPSIKAKCCKIFCNMASILLIRFPPGTASIASSCASSWASKELSLTCWSKEASSFSLLTLWWPQVLRRIWRHVGQHSLFEWQCVSHHKFRKCHAFGCKGSLFQVSQLDLPCQRCWPSSCCSCLCLLAAVFRFLTAHLKQGPLGFFLISLSWVFWSFWRWSRHNLMPWRWWSFWANNLAIILFGSCFWSGWTNLCLILASFRVFQHRRLLGGFRMLGLGLEAKRCHKKRKWSGPNTNS